MHIPYWYPIQLQLTHDDEHLFSNIQYESSIQVMETKPYHRYHFKSVIVFPVKVTSCQKETDQGYN